MQRLVEISVFRQHDATVLSNVNLTGEEEWYGGVKLDTRYFSAFIPINELILVESQNECALYRTSEIGVNLVCDPDGLVMCVKELTSSFKQRVFDAFKMRSTRTWRDDLYHNLKGHQFSPEEILGLLNTSFYINFTGIVRL